MNVIVNHYLVPVVKFQGLESVQLLDISNYDLLYFHCLKDRPLRLKLPSTFAGPSTLDPTQKLYSTYQTK